MKRTKRNPAARAYFRAFYDGNRLNFGLTALLTLLGIPVTLSVSWLLGELLDAASARSMEQLVTVHLQSGSREMNAGTQGLLCFI